MNNYPKVVSVTRMPDGKALEIVKVQNPPKTATQLSIGFNYTLRDKENLFVLKICDTYHQALGEVYGRVKALEMKELKEKAKEPKLCANCQCMLEI